MRLEGKEYATHLEGLSDQEFLEECFDQIDRANQSAIYCFADERAKQCREEAARREDGNLLYDRGFNAALAAAKGDRHYRRALVALGSAA